MKIRTGFVSNSSSSSFVAWGVYKDDIPFDDNVMVKLFDEKLRQLEQMKSENLDRFNKWYRSDYSNMLDCKTDDEKVEYANDNLETDEFYEDGDFSKSGPNNDFVGMEPTHIVKNYPHVTFGEVQEFVAKKLNETFGTNFTSSDVEYFEEGWMDN